MAGFRMRVSGLRLEIVRRMFAHVPCCLCASLSETASGADLGGSSKYSNENFEG